MIPPEIRALLTRDALTLPSVALGTWNVSKVAELTGSSRFFIRDSPLGPFVMDRETRTKIGKTSIDFDVDIRSTKAKCGHEECGAAWAYVTSRNSVNECKAETFKAKALVLSESPEAEYRIVDNATLEVVESKRFADLNAE